jgi:hypothetical protein
VELLIRRRSGRGTTARCLLISTSPTSASPPSLFVVEAWSRGVARAAACACARRTTSRARVPCQPDCCTNSVHVQARDVLQHAWRAWRPTARAERRVPVAATWTPRARCCWSTRRVLLAHVGPHASAHAESMHATASMCALAGLCSVWALGASHAGAVDGEYCAGVRTLQASRALGFRCAVADNGGEPCVACRPRARVCATLSPSAAGGRRAWHVPWAAAMQLAPRCHVCAQRRSRERSRSCSSRCLHLRPGLPRAQCLVARSSRGLLRCSWRRAATSVRSAAAVSAAARLRAAACTCARACHVRSAWWRAAAVGCCVAAGAALPRLCAAPQP